MMLSLHKAGRSTYGFSLIELMIVVAIISILAAIAFPAYDAYVIRGKRAEGRALLMDSASKMEKHYGDCLKFGSTIAATRDCAAGNVNFCGKTTCESETGKYEVAIINGSVNAYTLTADPQLPFADIQCGILILKHTGEKCINAAAGEVCSSDDATAQETVRQCWGR